MKKYILIIYSIITTLTFTSCQDWLTEPVPGKTTLEDYFSNGNAAIFAVNGAYVPLAWEYNRTFYSEWFIGDVVSDDALKGGQDINDMASVFQMENFKVTDNNELLLDFYRGQYQGTARCNLALEKIAAMQPDTIMTERLQQRLLGELKFLRAMYYFRLVRVFGDVPYIDFPIMSSKDWKQPYMPASQIYDNIIKDLEDAERMLWKKSEYPAQEMGRATKGAAQAMLLKAHLYKAGLFTKDYTEAKRWGDIIYAEYGSEYNLVPNYADNFTLAGQNGPESVFEIQYITDDFSDWGDAVVGGNGFTRGTFTVVLTRSRSSKLGAGWGFNKPTYDLYNAYESGDPRRDITILEPTDAEIEIPSQEIYLGNRLLSLKYAMRENGKFILLDHPTRAPINYKLIRYSDVLLMYAEACVETGDLGTAKTALEMVRARARGDNSILPEVTTTDPTELKNAIRHERRVELAMEGHRWFDIVRWGIAADVMNTYRDNESPEVREHMNPFRKGYDELFPIPSQELALNPR